jgi:hypothetical protein
VRAEFRQISEQSSGRHHCLRQRLAEHKESASPLLGNENHANIPKIHKLNRLQQLAGFPLGPEYLGGARLGSGKASALVPETGVPALQKSDAVSNFVQTAMCDRPTLINAERFPVISPRLKSARTTNVAYAYGKAPHYGALSH